MPHMEFVDNSIRRYGSAGQPRSPDMARNGRMVMLQTTSDGGHNNRGLLSSYEEMIAQGVREMFGLADLIRGDDRLLQTDLIGVEDEADRTRIRFNFFHQLCDLHQAAGVVGLKRIVDQDPSLVLYQLSYIDCAGDVYETVNIEPFPASPSADGQLRDVQFAKIRRDISEGLGRTPVTARGNFKIFGTYIGDGEHRSFSTIKRSGIKPDALIINVAPGGTAAFAGLRDGEEVLSLNQYDLAKLRTYTNDQLTALYRTLEERGELINVNYKSFWPRNICGYLSLQNKGIRGNRIGLGLP